MRLPLKFLATNHNDTRRLTNSFCCGMRTETNCRKRGLTCRKVVRKKAGRRSSFAILMTNNTDVVGGEPSAITKLQALVLAGVSRHLDSSGALLLVLDVLLCNGCHHDASLVRAGLGAPPAIPIPANV